MQSCDTVDHINTSTQLIARRNSLQQNVNSLVDKRLVVIVRLCIARSGDFDLRLQIKWPVALITVLRYNANLSTVCQPYY